MRFQLSVTAIIVLLTLTLLACGTSPSNKPTASSAKTASTADNQAAAKKPTTSFPEKNIEFVVGYKSGGGYSDWALALAPFLEKHLPHKVSVTVRHMDGAGGALAAGYVQKAKPDGYTIGIYNVAGLAATQLASEVKYDLRAVTWLARVSLDPTVVVVSSKSKYQGIKDFQKQEKAKYIVSTKGLAATNTISAAITFRKLNVNWTTLNHAGTSESILSVIRGDADLTLGSYDSVKQYIDNGDVRPILYYDSKRHPKMPNISIPSEVGMPELNESMNSHRVIGAPPKLPSDIRGILEEAIRKSVEDPEFQAVLKKMKLSTDYLNGKDTEKVVLDLLTSYDAYKDAVKDLLNQDKK